MLKQIPEQDEKNPYLPDSCNLIAKVWFFYVLNVAWLLYSAAKRAKQAVIQRVAGASKMLKWKKWKNLGSSQKVENKKKSINRRFTDCNEKRHLLKK